jgi:hypothetical protein
VNHIPTLEHELHRPPDWNVNFVRRNDPLARIRILIRELPPPLAADHLDRDRAIRWVLAEGVADREARDQEGEEDENRGGDRSKRW